MDRLLRDLRQQQDDAAILGDEIEAERLGMEINNVESLMFSLPWPNWQQGFHMSLSEVEW